MVTWCNDSINFLSTLKKVLALFLKRHNGICSFSMTNRLLNEVLLPMMSVATLEGGLLAKLELSFTMWVGDVWHDLLKMNVDNSNLFSIQNHQCPRLPGSVFKNVRGCLAPSSKCPRLPGSVLQNVRGCLAPSSISNFPISMTTVWNLKIPTSRGCSPARGPLPCQVSLRSVKKPPRR